MRDPNVIDYAPKPISSRRRSRISVWAILSALSILLLFLLPRLSFIDELLPRFVRGKEGLPLSLFAFIAGLLGLWDSARKKLSIWNIPLAAFGLIIGLLCALVLVYLAANLHMS